MSSLVKIDRAELEFHYRVQYSVFDEKSGIQSLPFCIKGKMSKDFFGFFVF